MNSKITLPTDYGDLQFTHFSHSGQEGVVVFNMIHDPAPFIRIHSSCIFSETFGSIDCDCAAQLHAALKYISTNGGYVVYLYQEGRGLGLREKIEAIALQERESVNTAEAFARLGHEPDPRNYDAVVKILEELALSKVKLATNNPRKIAALEAAGIVVVDRVALDIETNELMRAYIDEKRNVLGHYEND